MSTRKLLAKKIITNPPISVIGDYLFPESFQKQLQKTDETMHRWALVIADSFSESEWQEIQKQKLKKILSHAGDNVVFWHNLFKKTGFDPNRFENFSDLGGLPVITRSLLKSVPRDALMALNVPESRQDAAATSGSTSEPFSFFHDKRDVFRRKMNVFFELRHGGLRENSRALILGLGSLKGLRDYRFHVNPHDLEAEDWRRSRFYPLLSKIRPEILFSTPSYIARLAHFFRKDGFSYAFSGIRFYGESMNQSELKELEDFFQCKIFSTYGTQECSIIGIECEKRGLHLVPWLNYVEIVDDQGHEVKPEEIGNIVVTFFENECMPFIRYALGDRGTILKEKCLCGRSSPLLKFDGRTLGFLEFRDGSIYHISHIAQYIAENYSDLMLKFQLEQPENTKLIFRYIPRQQDNCGIIERKLKSYFDSFLDSKAEVGYEMTDYIMPDIQGKTKILIKKLNVL